MPSPSRLFKRFCTAGTKGFQILVSLGEHLSPHFKYYARYDQVPGIHGKPRRVLLLVGEAQQAGCLKVRESSLSEWDANIQ